VDTSEIQNPLLRRAVRGDKEAFARLYDELAGPLYRFAFHMLGERAQAEDTVHEAFLTLLNAAKDFDEARGNLLNFALGITRKLVLRHLRWRLRWFASPPEDLEHFSNYVEASAQERLELAEQVAAVRKGVASLPVKYREVITLCELSEMSYEAAAAQIGCSVGTVRSRLHRAHALLAEKLKLRFCPDEKGRPQMTEVATP
jgi:RNA polymerase sigma-70 factor, ECF subfamily